MAVFVFDRWRQHLKPVKRRIGHRALALEHGAQLVAALFNLSSVAPIAAAPVTAAAA